MLTFNIAILTLALLYRQWGLPLITYAPRGKGGVKPSIHFYCVLHAKRGGGGGGSRKHVKMRTLSMEGPHVNM